MFSLKADFSLKEYCAQGRGYARPRNCLLAVTKIGRLTESSVREGARGDFWFACFCAVRSFSSILQGCRFAFGAGAARPRGPERDSTSEGIGEAPSPLRAIMTGVAPRESALRSLAGSLFLANRGEETVAADDSRPYLPLFSVYDLVGA